MGKRRNPGILAAALAVLCLLAMASCQKEEKEETLTVDTLFEAILNCPNEELVSEIPVAGYIPLEETAPQEPETSAGDWEAEVESWRQAVGGLFEENDFQYFMEDNPARIEFHLIAQQYSVSTSVQAIEAEELRYGTQYFNVTIQVSRKEGGQAECVTRWKVDYNPDHPEKVEEIELVDVGDLYEIVRGQETEAAEENQPDLLSALSQQYPEYTVLDYTEGDAGTAPIRLAAILQDPKTGFSSSLVVVGESGVGQRVVLGIDIRIDRSEDGLLLKENTVCFSLDRQDSQGAFQIQDYEILFMEGEKDGAPWTHFKTTETARTE